MGNKEKKFKVQMTKDALFDFMLHHAYAGGEGLLSVIFSVVFAAVGVALYVMGKTSMNWMLCLIIIGIALAFSTPFQLRNDAARQMRKNPIYMEPVTYAFSDKGISVTQKGNKKFFTWKQISKVRITKKAVGFYYERQYALVLTRDAFDVHGLIDFVKANMPSEAIK